MSSVYSDSYEHIRSRDLCYVLILMETVLDKFPRFEANLPVDSSFL